MSVFVDSVAMVPLAYLEFEPYDVLCDFHVTAGFSDTSR